jgi:hypothetical protein
MERVPPDPMCFDCWLADDDASIRPKHLERDGEPLYLDGTINTPWRCAACEQHWLLVCDEATDSQTFQRCSR